jgi:hypothetical protein
MNQLEQSGIVQELINGIEQIVFEQRSLQGQGGIEQPGLVRGCGTQKFYPAPI